MRERSWELAVRDMLDCCEQILVYTAGMDLAAFTADRRTYDATIRNIEVVGEAANNVPRHVWDAHPEIPWRGVIATRNRIIHGYGVINDEAIWAIIRRDVPELIPQLRALLAEAEEDQAQPR